MKFCVIGLGRFGKQVVKTLHENGAEVLAIDTIEANIESVKHYTAQAICTRINDEETLEAIGIDEMDVVIIGIGENFAQSILVAAMLKNRHAKYRIIVRANGQIQKDIFRLIGVDQIICPEEETAIELADMLSYPFTNLAKLDAHISVGQINPPAEFIGKSIEDLMLFDTYKINCFAIKQNDNVITVDQHYIITKNDKLIVAGDNYKIKQLLHL